MKTVSKKIFLALTLSAAALTSCKQKQDSLSLQEEADAEQIMPSVNPSIPLTPLKKEETKNGIILSSKTQLYLLGRDKKMHGYKSLFKGDGISALYQDNNPVIKTFKTSDENKPEESFVLVIHNFIDSWIPLKDCALECKSAVLTQNSSLYSDKELSKKTEKTLRFGEIVAVPSSASQEESGKIFYYNKESGAVLTAYINQDNASTLVDDIEVSKIVQELKNTQKAVARNNLFTRASKYKPSAKVKAALEDQKVERISYDYQEVLESLNKMQKKSTYSINVQELMTVDQSKDPFAN